MNKVCLFLALTLVLTGCFSTSKTPVTIEPRVPVKFDYSPPSRTQSGATGMTIALIRPVYITPKPEYYINPFPEMSSSMGNDFEELLTAKGFTIRGPFASRDAMVYNDKLSCSFAFIVEIELEPNYYNRKYRYDPGFGTIVAPSYKMSGEVTLGGNLVLTASSPQFGEKLWKKNIALDRATFTYVGSLKWNAIPTISEELQQDNVFYNRFTKELEQFYDRALALAWQQIDPAEMKTIADQAKKADKRP